MGSSDQSYIAASYIKYLEAAGARVIPVPHYYEESQVRKLFQHVNGFLMPGGGIKFFTSPYYKISKIFWDLALEANEKNDFFPIWGTCMGFEVMNVLAVGKDVVSERISNDKALPLDFIEDSAARSRLFGPIHSEHLYEIFGKEKVTYNHHGKGVTRKTYGENPKLNNFFSILSVNLDEYGREFISTIEARKYPFYGVQWHPEKNNFEHTTLYSQLPNSANGVLVAQYTANFFVNEARKNLHKFPSKEMEENSLIYNYNPIYSARKYSNGTLVHFEQIYIFDSKFNY